MQNVFVAGDEPVPGYRLFEEIEGSAFYKVWKVQTPEGVCRWWKIIDLIVGNAAIETRTLGLLVRLRHPHLNTLTNFWNLDDGRTLIIESDVPVRSLRALLDSRANQPGTGIPFEELVPYIEQAAEGLDFLNKPQHDYNGQQVAIYHRSLRPECLLLFEENERLVCKVSDFGLSKPVTDEVAQHSQGLLHYDYDPPEFFEGQTTPSSDQYALAVNYYELRTGRMPFAGTMLEQLQARLNDKPDLSYIDEPERSILRKALHRDPSRRFKSALDFVKHLKDGKVPDGMTAHPSSRELGTVAASTARVVNPSLSGVTAPRPSSNASAPPAWRSPTTAALQPRPAAEPNRSSNGTTASAQLATSAAGNASLATAESRNGLRFTPRGTADEGNSKTSGVAENPQTRPSPTKVKGRPVPTANLRSIREHIGDGGGGFADALSGERRIPLIWVVLILSLTAMASVFGTSFLWR